MDKDCAQLWKNAEDHAFSTFLQPLTQFLTTMRMIFLYVFLFRFNFEAFPSNRSYMNSIVSIEHSLESGTKPRFFQLWSKPVIISKKWTKSVVCTCIQPCFGVLIVCPLHESKSNGEGIHPSTWRTWICSLTFAEGRSNRSKTHLIASIWKEIHIFHKRHQCWCFRRLPHHLPWPVAWFTRTSLRVHCTGAM